MYIKDIISFNLCLKLFPVFFILVLMLNVNLFLFSTRYLKSCELSFGEIAWHGYVKITWLVICFWEIILNLIITWFQNSSSCHFGLPIKGHQLLSFSFSVIERCSVCICPDESEHLMIQAISLTKLAAMTTMKTVIFLDLISCYHFKKNKTEDTLISELLAQLEPMSNLNDCNSTLE